MSTDLHEHRDSLRLSHDRLKLIARLGGFAVGSVPLAELSHSILAAVRDAFGTDACAVRYIDGDDIVLLASVGIPEGSTPMRLSAHEGLAGAMIREVRPAVVRDVRTNPACAYLGSESEANATEHFSFVSYAGAPMQADGRVVGLLGIFSTGEPRDFSDSDLDLLQIVANQIAVAMINDRLYGAMREQAGALEREIAERQRAQRELDRFFNLSADPLCIANFDGYFLRVNPAWGEVLGRTQEEMLATPFLAFVHPDDVLRTSRELNNLKSGEGRERFQNRYRHRDGHYVWLSWSTVPLPEEGLVYAIARDVTRIKAEEEEVLRHRDRLEELVENRTRELEATNNRLRREVRDRTQLAHLASRLSGIDTLHEMVVTVSEASESMMRWDAHFFGVLRPGTDLMESLFVVDTIGGAKAMLPGTQWRRGESKLLKRLGKEGAFLLNGPPNAPLSLVGFGDEHRPSISRVYAPVVSGETMIGLLSVQSYVEDFFGEEDVRRLEQFASVLAPAINRAFAEEARRQAEGALVNALEEARRATRVKAEFLANMSHEIRTPMNAILGMGELLMGTPLSPEQLDLCNIMRRAGEGLLVVVNDILDLSKIEAGRVRLEAIEFSVDDCLREVLEIIAMEAHERGLELRREHEGPPLPVISVGDPLRLRQILLNLTANAVKFTEAGTVTLRTRVDQSDAGAYTLTVEVEDTGLGIPADKIETLFQSFSQVEPSTSRRFGGTGLGLAISRRLVELMGGTIGVRSEIGRGSVFWFRIPMEQVISLDTPPRQETPRPADRIPLRRDARILVVEDNAMNCQVIEMILRREGIELIDFAHDGGASLDRFSKESYDLILMDCQMPNMDGYEATRAIRLREGKGPRVPIVALTANAMEGERERCIEAGMDDYLTKPIQRPLLLGTLRRYLSQPDHGKP